MVASAAQAEGKTLTAANVALTLSHSYQRRVLLIDADLRRPSIHTVLRLENRVGLGDILKSSPPSRDLPVQRVGAMLWAITAGPADPDPMSGLVSDTMKQFLVEAAEQFDWLVIDSPPVMVMPDANLLAAMVDTTLLVVRAHKTPYPMVMRAIEGIGVERILGVVLNRADRSDIHGGYEPYEYAPRPTEE
jgi:receptor protein-tyrosine kinase